MSLLLRSSILSLIRGSNSSPCRSFRVLPERSNISRSFINAGSQPDKELRRLLHNRTSRIMGIEARYTGQASSLLLEASRTHRFGVSDNSVSSCAVDKPLAETSNEVRLGGLHRSRIPPSTPSPRIFLRKIRVPKGTEGGFGTSPAVPWSGHYCSRRCKSKSSPRCS